MQTSTDKHIDAKISNFLHRKLSTIQQPQQRTYRKLDRISGISYERIAWHAK